MSLHDQAYLRMQSMLCPGQSKRAAKLDGTAGQKLFCFGTYRTYWGCVRRFLRWIKENHPECGTLKHARKHVPEYLEKERDRGLSAWTVHVEAKALGKLFSISPDDPDYFHPPVRHGSDIFRSRRGCTGTFSEERHPELVAFCKATGLRRGGMQSLRGRDLYTCGRLKRKLEELASLPPRKRSERDYRKMKIIEDALRLSDFRYFIRVVEKGGKERFCPVIDSEELVMDIMARNPPEERVWENVYAKAPIHSYRAEYAAKLYLHYASGDGGEHEDLGFRKGSGGRMLDEYAMLMASKALGHNRTDVVRYNYLWKLDELEASRNPDGTDPP